MPENWFAGRGGPYSSSSGTCFAGGRGGGYSWSRGGGNWVQVSDVDHELVLVGQTEIAAWLGLTRQRVHQLARGEKTSCPLPPPAYRLSRGPLWLGEDVVRWAVESGRIQGVRERRAAEVA
jgi:hypothetical protein